ncbi:unnamed protein product [Rotaria magnacalcarata]|uniref:Uncharacterized protein n=1 Tax=Rotaria magnacalcarata TaxID=392030 RepID=A0A816X5C1_9BILA|nr:unnamed protein product [Rotaria magnacalcarata]
MSPRRGGGLHDRRKGEQDNARVCTPNTGTPQQPTITNELPPTQAARAELVISSLILEAFSNIQKNHSNTFTLYANDVKSFSRLLNELSSVIYKNEQHQSTIYISHSIQRVIDIDIDKEAFAKQVDLEIYEQEIKQSLTDQGFKFEKLSD